MPDFIIELFLILLIVPIIISIDRDGIYIKTLSISLFLAISLLTWLIYAALQEPKLINTYTIKSSTYDGVDIAVTKDNNVLNLNQILGKDLDEGTEILIKKYGNWNCGIIFSTPARIEYSLKESE